MWFNLIKFKILAMILIKSKNENEYFTLKQYLTKKLMTNKW